MHISQTYIIKSLKKEKKKKSTHARAHTHAHKVTPKGRYLLSSLIQKGMFNLVNSQVRAPRGINAWVVQIITRH